MRLAASLDQASKHPVAQALVAAARGLVLALPEAITEAPGEGVSGSLDGRKLVVGGADFVTTQVEPDVPRIFHPAVAKVLSSFTPIGAG